MIAIRLAVAGDLPRVLDLCGQLWPDESRGELGEHIGAVLAGTPRSTLPLVLFVAEMDAGLAGFVEVGLRSHAQGCDGARAVGFIEGWYVRPELRRRGVGRALVARAEQWSREQGAVEMASDTWLDHQLSINAHQALGFEVVERCTQFRKAL